MLLAVMKISYISGFYRSETATRLQAHRRCDIIMLFNQSEAKSISIYDLLASLSEKGKTSILERTENQNVQRIKT